jgi:hypothetical protein
MLKRTCLLLLLALAFGSCKNDLNVNAPYKELPTVYALLTPQDEMQMIRINKVFLGEGDAFAMAKISDSINYPAGELEVTLTRFINDAQVDATPEGTDRQKIVFYDSVIHNVADGAFAQEQRLYITHKKLFTSGQYRLSIRNRNTGNVFTARAEAIDSLQDRHTLFPPLTEFPHYLYDPQTSLNEYVDYSSPSNPSTPKYEYVRFAPDGVAKIYQVKIRTHWFDSTATMKTDNYVDYDFGTRNEKTKVKKFGMDIIETQFRTVDYWNAIGLAMSKKNLTDNIFGRRAYMIEYFVYSSTPEYLDFLEYNAPSFAISQNSRIYSNFDNEAAIGIFTFRARYSVKKQPASTMVNEFSYNANTCQYRFVDSHSPGQVIGCK